MLRDLALEQGFADPEAWARWGTSPCKAACPAHISIPGFISAILQGRYAEGLKLIKQELPFPGICGRVCPHPCEAKCNRGQLDQPVAIMYLKRFPADQEMGREPRDTPPLPAKKPQQGRTGLRLARRSGVQGWFKNVLWEALYCDHEADLISLLQSL